MDFPVNEDGWPLSPDGYELLVEIGQGAFAKVIKARCPSKDTFVAVKVMALENITTSLEEIQAEVRTMKLSKNENVLDLYCCFVVKSDLWLVMPHMDKGSCYYALRMLRKLGKLHEGQGLSEDIISIILREVLAGLDYIHGQHQIHRDVKAGNILLNAEGRIAIADFGVAGWLSEAGARSEGERKTFVGTPCWMAPEVRYFAVATLGDSCDCRGACYTGAARSIQVMGVHRASAQWHCATVRRRHWNYHIECARSQYSHWQVMEQQHGYNEKADIWSVGITALELLKGYAPYSKYAPMQVRAPSYPPTPPPALNDSTYRHYAVSTRCCCRC